MAPVVEREDLEIAADKYARTRIMGRDVKLGASEGRQGRRPIGSSSGGRGVRK